MYNPHGKYIAMDEMDKKILALLHENARMTVKEIAGRVSLTSPAVSERIHRMERNGVIDGYTVRLAPNMRRGQISALVSLTVSPSELEEFYDTLVGQEAVELCYQIIGNHSHMVKVSCPDIDQLDALLSQLQKYGSTSTQIILATRNGVVPGLGC